jgi:hypothetical protein
MYRDIETLLDLDPTSPRARAAVEEPASLVMTCDEALFGHRTHKRPLDAVAVFDAIGWPSGATKGLK